MTRLPFAMLRAITASILLAIAASASAASGVQLAFQRGKLAPIGQATVVEIDVSNSGPDPATNVTFTYTPAPQLTYAGYRSGQQTTHPDPTVSATCTTPRPGDSGAISCTISTLAPSRSVFFLYRLNVPASVAPGATLTHTASTATQTITFSNTAAPMPQLDLSTTFPKTVVAGSTFEFTVSVHNTSSFDATNVYFDAVSSDAVLGVTQSAGAPQPCLSEVNDDVRCEQMTIPAGDTIVFSITAKSDPGLAGSLDDIDVTLLPRDFSFDGFQEIDPVAFATAYPDPAVTITAPRKATVNTPYLVHVIAYAAGPSGTRNTTMTFTTPAGTTFNSITPSPMSGDYSSSTAPCSVATVGATRVVTCTITYEVPPYLEEEVSGARAEFDISLTPTATGTVTEAVTVSSATDIDPSNDTASATTTIVSGPVTDLAASILQAATAGDPGFAVSATNRGSVAATNVVVSVTLPAGVTSPSASCSGSPVVCTRTFPTLAPQAQATLLVLAHVPIGTPSITLNATVSSSTDDSDPTNDTASLTTYFGDVNAGDLTLTAFVADGYGTPQRLPAAVPPGATIVYQVTAASGTPPTLTLTVPPGGAFVTTPSDGTVNGNSFSTSALTAPYRLTATATAPATPGTYTAKVTLAPAGRTASVTIVVASGAQIPPSADLSVDVAAPLLVQPGDTASYAVSVVNRGPQPASNVRLTATLPSGATLDHVEAPAGVTCSGTVVCTAGSLANGATMTVNIVVRPPQLALGALLPLTASVTSDTADINPNNNHFAAATTIAYPTKLSMRVDPSNVAVPPGAQFVTTVTVTNNGQSTVTGVTIDDVPPNVLKVISANATATAGCAHTSALSCTASVLNPGEQVVITAVVQAPQSGSVTQKRFAFANAVDAVSSEAVASQTVITMPHPKHRAAP